MGLIIGAPIRKIMVMGLIVGAPIRKNMVIGLIIGALCTHYEE